MTEEDGQLQNNKLNGENAMAIYFGRPIPHPLLDPHGHKMSPNHRWEAAVVRFASKTPLAKDGRAAVLEFFNAFKQRGFMRLADANELLTRSHGPIWDRIFAMLLWSARQQDDAEMVTVAMTLWSWYVFLSDLVRVPTGPLAGRRVTVNGRYAPWSGTSDCVQQLINGERILEPRIIVNGAVYQDNFAALVVQRLVRDGAFTSLPINAQPPMPCDFSMQRYTDGHLTYVPPNSLENGDPDTVAVRYSTGEVLTGGAAAHADLGYVGGALVRIAA